MDEVTKPPSYGQIPGVVPAHQGSSQGPPPSYQDATDPEAPPPSYNSLFGQVREARKSSSGMLEFVGKLIIILLGTLGCTILLGFTLMIPVAMLIVGSMYIRDCPVEPYIPIYLLVGGTFGIIKNLLTFLKRCHQEGDEEEGGGRSSNKNISRIMAYLRILDFFLVAWFIAGCIWVYSNYQPDFYDPTSIYYCHKTVYQFAFWIITSSFIILGIFMGIICCVTFCTLIAAASD